MVMTTHNGNGNGAYAGQNDNLLLSADTPAPAVPGGDYDSFINHLMALASGAEVDLVENLQKCSWESEEDKIYVSRLVEAGMYQLTSEAALRDLIIENLESRIDVLRSAMRGGESRNYEQMEQELNDVEKQLVRLKIADANAVRLGVKYSAKPLLEFMALPEDQRRGRSYTALLPPELQKAHIEINLRIDINAAWFIHRESMAAQQLPGSAMGKATLNDYALARAGKRGGWRRSPGYQDGNDE